MIAIDSHPTDDVMKKENWFFRNNKKIAQTMCNQVLFTFQNFRLDVNRWSSIHPLTNLLPAMPASPIPSNYTRNEQWVPWAVYGKRGPLRRKLRGKHKLTRRAPKTTRKATRWTRTSWLPVKADRPKHRGLTPRGGVLRKVGLNDPKKRNGCSRQYLACH